MDASDMLKAAINQAFGNYTNFQTQFSAAANGVFGAGQCGPLTAPQTKVFVRLLILWAGHVVCGVQEGALCYKRYFCIACL